MSSVEAARRVRKALADLERARPRESAAWLSRLATRTLEIAAGVKSPLATNRREIGVRWFEQLKVATFELPTKDARLDASLLYLELSCQAHNFDIPAAVLPRFLAAVVALKDDDSHRADLLLIAYNLPESAMRAAAEADGRALMDDELIAATEAIRARPSDDDVDALRIRSGALRQSAQVLERRALLRQGTEQLPDLARVRVLWDEAAALAPKADPGGLELDRFHVVRTDFQIVRAQGGHDLAAIEALRHEVEALDVHMDSRAVMLAALARVEGHPETAWTLAEAVTHDQQAPTGARGDAAALMALIAAERGERSKAFDLLDRVFDLSKTDLQYRNLAFGYNLAEVVQLCVR